MQPGRIAVIGCGARTPLGFDRIASAAAVRAGIPAAAEHPYMIDRFGEPMRVARDHGLDPLLTGVQRQIDLALPAAREALAPVLAFDDLFPAYLLVCTGEPRPGQPESFVPILVEALRASLGKRIGTVAHLARGHAGGVLGLAVAVQAIREGRAQLALVGGIDSYLHPETLEWLDDQEQLHSEHNLWGFCPGEAAGFVLLASADLALARGIKPLLELAGAGYGRETNLIKTEDICVGEGLSDAFRATVAPGQPKVDRILCDMNGERYRGAEYGFAAIKNPGIFHNAAMFETPADCWGDVGAAAGPLMVCLAAEAEARNYSKGQHTLIWASSEQGLRAAALLRKM
jgi:3-oxoacyl-[acyl-carrier-protein] synthase-1